MGSHSPRLTGVPGEVRATPRPTPQPWALTELAGVQPGLSEPLVSDLPAQCGPRTSSTGSPGALVEVQPRSPAQPPGSASAFNQVPGEESDTGVGERGLGGTFECRPRADGSVYEGPGSGA